MTGTRNGNGAVHPVHVLDAFGLALGRFAVEVGSEVARLNAVTERDQSEAAVADAERRLNNLRRLEAVLSPPVQQERRA